MTDDSATSRVPALVGDLPESAPRTPGLLALRGALMALDNERIALAEAGDYEQLARGGAAIDIIAGDLGAILRSTKLDIARILDTAESERRAAIRAEEYPGVDEDDPAIPYSLSPRLGPVRAEVEGVGAVDVNGGWDRKNWQSMKLLERMLHIALDPMDLWSTEGEEQHDAVIERLMDVLGEVMPLHPSLQWKVGRYAKGKPPTGMKRFQLDDEEWCDRTPKPRQASWPRQQ